MARQTVKRTFSLWVLGSLFLLLAGGIFYWLAVGADMSNPHANFWRVVRQGIPGFMTAPSDGHTVLIQNSGENWRELRNGLIMPLAQWVLALALVAMGLFYFFIGKDRLEEPRSGIRIERYTLGERVLHWYTALLFVIIAVTGLSMLLGRVLLIPIFGHWAVSGYLQTTKVLHNYLGPFLLVGILLEILIWFRNNIPKKEDLTWFKTLGGMFGSGPRPHTGRINAGEKGWFWLVLVFGLASGITGIIMDFPIWGQTRLTMEVTHIIHAAVAVLFVTASFGHIYLGTIGAEGTFEAMWTGSVDSVWAKQHNDLWYAETMQKGGLS